MNNGMFSIASALSSDNLGFLTAKKKNQSIKGSIEYPVFSPGHVN